MGIAIKLPQLRSRPEKQEPKKRTRKPVARPEQGGRSKKPLPEPVRKTRGAATKGATRKATAPTERQPRSFNWLNRILILVGTGVVAVAGLQAYITLQSIPVERISVTGALEHTQTTAVQDMVYPALTGGFLGADLGNVQQQLEALPWIHEATVRRVWPNALEIHVVEQLPIARWGDSGFLNHEGEVFRPSQRNAWQTLPTLMGPENTAPALMRTYQRLVDLLAPLGLGLSELSVDDRGEIAAVLAGGQRMVIGGEDFLERMKRFKTVYRAELATQMALVESIDLRYERGVAVAFKAPVEELETTNDNKKA
ncbi:MAG: cell division protein FtsQ/DivIB [Halioglobus sp.]